MFLTPTGLRLRTVGKFPGTADPAGIRVKRMRYGAVIIGGMVTFIGDATVNI